MIRNIQLLIGAFVATRFLTAITIAVTSLIYGGLTQLGIVPRYDSLVWTTPAGLFFLVYGLIGFAFCIVWLRGPGARFSRSRTQYRFRYVYRQSDQAGVRVFSAFALLVIVIGAYFLRSYGLFQQDVVLFMAFVLGFPLLLDFFPQSPRRFVIPTNVESIEEVLEALGFERDHPQRQAALRILRDYNREMGSPVESERFWFDPSAVSTLNNAIRIEIPPVVHQMALDDQTAPISFDDDPPPPPPPTEEPAPPDVDATAASEAVAPPPASDEAGDVVPEKIGTPKDGEEKLWS